MISSSSHNTIRSKLLYNTIQCTWIWSGLAAICVTILLFSLMPFLLKPIGKHTVRKKRVVQVKITDIPPDTPVAPEEPEPQLLLPKKIRLVPLSKSYKMPKPRLSLAIEDNPRPVAKPFTIDISSMARAAMGDLEVPDVFKTGDLDQPLVTLNRMPPIYPIRARQKKIQGYVRTRFVVNIHGTVNEVIIIESNPPGVFDQSVINCISDWRFLPGTVDGEPVDILAETTLNFKLEQNE